MLRNTKSPRQSRRRSPRFLAAIVLALASAWIFSLGVAAIQGRVETVLGPVAAELIYLLKIPVFIGLWIFVNSHIWPLSSGQTLAAVRWWRGFPSGYLLGTLFSAMSVLVALLFVGPDEFRMVGFLPGALANLASLFLFTFVTGYTEEIVFRGVIFAAILNFSNRLHVSAVGSAIIFVIPHIFLGNPNTHPVWYLGIFLLGVALAYLYTVTSSLGLIAGLHAAWNFVTDIAEKGHKLYGIIEITDFRSNAALFELAAISVAMILVITSAIAAESHLKTRTPSP